MHDEHNLLAMRPAYRLLFTLFTLVTIGLQAQIELDLVEMCELPSVIDESSGLAIAGERSLWTHNDRGGNAEIFEVDVRGELLRTVELTDVTVHDMEDVAMDKDGMLFIGDFGNNKKDRLKLSILRVDPRQIQENKVRPEVIEFLLPDNGLNSKCHYDIEAMIWSKGRLVMFTKDRCDENNNHLVIYSVPDEPGHYTAAKMGEFYWEEPDKCIKITGANLSPDGKKLVLLSRNGLHFFFAYNRDEYFNGSYRYLELEDRKREGLVHYGDCELFISEEAKKGAKAKLWKLNLCSIGFN